jgi:hypothetical protein
VVGAPADVSVAAGRLLVIEVEAHDEEVER